MHIFIRLLFAGMCFCSDLFAEDLFTISVLDIGEGDSILLEDKQNNKNILLDSGTPLAGKKLIAALKARNIKSLDNAIISHPHLDHFGGLFPLETFLHPKKFYDNGESVSEIKSKEVIYRLYEELARSENYRALREGDKLNLGGLSLTALSSVGSINSKDWNTNSLVLLAEYKTFKLLLMGDGNKETEKYLAEKYCDRIKHAILKSGHHGANDTASEAFLECLKPPYVIISVNQGNVLGLPHEETLNRYKNAAMKVLLTSLNGEILMHVKSDGTYQVKSR